MCRGSGAEWTQPSEHHSHGWRRLKRLRTFQTLPHCHIWALPQPQLQGLGLSLLHSPSTVFSSLSQCPIPLHLCLSYVDGETRQGSGLCLSESLKLSKPHFPLLTNRLTGSRLACGVLRPGLGLGLQENPRKNRMSNRWGFQPRGGSMSSLEPQESGSRGFTRPPNREVPSGVAIPNHSF